MKVLSDGGIKFEDEIEREEYEKRQRLLDKLTPDEREAHLRWEADRERKRDPFPETMKQSTALDDSWAKHTAKLRKQLRYPFETVSEFNHLDTVERAWLQKRIIAYNETSAWIAPPGGMKSALLAELCFHVARGMDWHGHKSVRSSGVVYFALERADLVKRRLLAHCRRGDLSEQEMQALDIAVCSQTIDLVDPASVKHVVDTVEAFEAITSATHSVGLLVFDTFAKLIAAGGGDEDKAAWQGKVFANIQRIKDKLGGPHVALIGHTGKDESRGARGSNAFLGDADIMVQISGDVVKSATVVKANDMPEGPLFSFTSATHEFGKDEDGDPITVNVVSDEEVSAPQKKAREPRLKPNQQTLFGILHEAGRNGLTTEEWNAAAREAGIGVKRPAALVDIHMALKGKGLVSDYGGRWTVNHGG